MMFGGQQQQQQSRPRTRRKRATKGEATNGSSWTGSASCILVLTGLYVLFLCQTEHVISSVESGQNFRFHGLLFQQPKKSSSVAAARREAEVVTSGLPTNNTASSHGDRFLVFSGQLGGQGLGNIVSGLLAAHLLGQEFSRFVCVLPDFVGFADVFESTNEEVLAKCPHAVMEQETRANSISLVNYEKPPNECELKDLLSSAITVVFMSGNTYPRWPVVPDRFFMRHYRAKQQLLDALSYDVLDPPKTVVHLRTPDGNFDANRLGLDEASLLALAKALPKGKDTFLVTNRVAFYQRFEECCQWSHPKWNSVVHSASGIKWGSLSNAKSSVSQTVQMWADWYTLLNARELYHTHSDFSISATHWMNNTNSHSIVGPNQWTGFLETQADPWVADGATTPVSLRTMDAKGDSQLRLCDRRNTLHRNNFIQSRNHVRPGSLSTLLEKRLPQKILLFAGVVPGQGAGNVVSGLLSAHLLGREFNRTVCVLPSFKGFLEAFEPIGSVAQRECPRILKGNPEQTGANTITMLTFSVAPNECEVKDKLASQEKILFLDANTYPRWPAIPDRFFFQHYRPKQALLDALSYDAELPPETVVHLREPDGENDLRGGLDEASLVALERTFPKGKEIFLVTNRVSFYQRFADCCQWSHPKWNIVTHSFSFIIWGNSTKAADSTLSQSMQLWADWYTILIAPNVYHTHSDFSISAIHWMNKRNSRSIVGFNESSGRLETTRESWIVDGETVPLSQRSLESDGLAKLRSCTGNIKSAPPQSHLPQPTTGMDKFLFFDDMAGGQGIGNVVSGLLSAHLLGEEFNRTVCVRPSFASFLEVFDAINENSVKLCPRALEEKVKNEELDEYVVSLVNYMEAPNECKLKKKLQSSAEVIFFTGNTYPRWPVVPSRFFFKYYRAKTNLLDALPYDPNSPPSTVVHLRSPDDEDDKRRGLDNETLTALGNALPKGNNTFLVTNRVAYFQRFVDCCQWSHPKWSNVKHSALGINWGKRDSSRSVSSFSQNVQMWADWYTILTAKAVYHTYSDFSISAIHWMDIKDSHTIIGSREGVLKTEGETWRIDGETAPMVQRTLKANDTSQLRLCHS